MAEHDADERARRNRRLALIHVGLALLILAGFVYRMSHGG
jgi:hypothetical protein